MTDLPHSDFPELTPLTPDTPAGDAGEDPALRVAIERIDAMRTEIKKALLGQEAVIDQTLVALLASGHVLLEGVPGLGKTLLVLALARTFKGDFARIQFTPDLMPSDVTGHVMYDTESGKFHVRRGPAFTNLLLADEINRAPAKTQAALLEVMQERQITIEGESLPLPPPFMTFATQNPIEQEGTYPLPEAQLDRFLLKVDIGYPDEVAECDIVRHVTAGHTGSGFNLDDVQPVATPEEIVEAQRLTARVRVVESVTRYAVQIVRATRDARGLAIGAGPRGAIALVRAARASALLAGRGFVVPDDVKSVALPALRHRVALAPELQLEGRSTDDALASILTHVEAPRQ